MGDGGLCLLPTPHGPEHRMEPAPAALQALVADLRELADARRVAIGVYGALPVGARDELDQGLETWWLVADPEPR